MAALYPLKVVKKVQETSDSVSLVLRPRAEHESVFRSYRPAQFLSFEFVIEGKKHLRSYSLSSCPLLDEELKTTVKRVAGGVVSHYIMDQLKEGDCVQSRKPMGKFFKPPRDLKPRHYYLFAGGSGITPLFSVLKTVLLSDGDNQVTLFYGNRNEGSVIYRSELWEWLGRYRDRFRLLSFLSRPGGGAVFGSVLSDRKPSGNKSEDVSFQPLEQEAWPVKSGLPRKEGLPVYEFRGRLSEAF